jgi:hypothetical protein
MAEWTKDELRKIGGADILRIAARRPDGTLRNLVPIWVVAYNDRLFVRSVNGRDAAWFRGTLATHEGHIRAGGLERDVTFVDAPDGVDDALDRAYRAKYAYSPASVAHINSPRARAATLELVARE